MIIRRSFSSNRSFRVDPDLVALVLGATIGHDDRREKIHTGGSWSGGSGPRCSGTR